MSDRERLIEIICTPIGTCNEPLAGEIADEILAAGFILPKPEAGDKDTARAVLTKLYEIWGVDITYIDDPFQGPEHLACIEQALAAKGAQMQKRVDEARAFAKRADEALCEVIFAVHPEWGTAPELRPSQAARCVEELKGRATAAEAALERARAALTTMLNRYVDMVNSGDCGFWNPEDEDCVKQARAALETPTCK